MKYIPALLLSCLGLAAALSAQDPDKAERIRKLAGAGEEAIADEKAQQAGENDGEVLDGKPAQPAVRSDLPRFCDFVGSTRPTPMSPGSAGTFHVIAVLKGDGVITDASQVNLDYQRQQGPILLGEPEWPAPKPGKLTTAFQNRPVFEDTMVVQIPVNVVAGAAFGKYPVTATVRAVLSQGSNGNAIGELKTQVNALVQVGETVVVAPMPPRHATTPPPTPAAAVDDAGKRPTAAAPSPAPTRPQPVPQPDAHVEPARPSAPAAAGDGQPGPSAAPAAPEKDGSQSLLLLVGGGFVVLVGIALLLARKK